MDNDLLVETQEWLSTLRTGSTQLISRPDPWERFYGKYNPFVRATIIACGVSSTNLEDRAQEAWIELIRSLPGLEVEPSRGSLLAWIRTVVFRVTRDAQRKLMQLKLVGEGQELVEKVHDPKTVAPATECEHREEVASLRSALNSFRDRTSQRNFKILCLISFDGLSAEETGSILNLSVPQVWARHHRVKRSFQRHLRRSGIY